MTLSVGNWVGTTIPYTYAIANSKITASNVVDILINTNTQSLLDAVRSAQISGYKQEAGKITIYAWGEKPTIDIPAELVIRGGI